MSACQNLINNGVQTLLFMHIVTTCKHHQCIFFHYRIK